jgi:VIT1/CCC1 family predicted Fe2+/Mn2+ transporter
LVLARGARRAISFVHFFWEHHIMKAQIAALAIAAATSAHAGDFFTGNDLYQRLTANNSTEKMVALGYIMGINDAVSEVLICSSGITARQANDVVKKSLENAPESRDRAASFLVIQSLSAVWPCKASGSNL